MGEGEIRVEMWNRRGFGVTAVNLITFSSVKLVIPSSAQVEGATLLIFISTELSCHPMADVWKYSLSDCTKYLLSSFFSTLRCTAMWDVPRRERECTVSHFLDYDCFILIPYSSFHFLLSFHFICFPFFHFWFLFRLSDFISKVIIAVQIRQGDKIREASSFFSPSLPLKSLCRAFSFSPWRTLTLPHSHTHMHSFLHYLLSPLRIAWVLRLPHAGKVSAEGSISHSENFCICLEWWRIHLTEEQRSKQWRDRILFLSKWEGRR